MSLATPPSKTMTAEELYALPEDGIHREMIRGELRESPMTYRNRKHSGVEAAIAHYLFLWLKEHPDLRGAIHSGEVGFRLRRDPLTLVGVDVAYVSEAVKEQTDSRSPFFDGAPVLAVEILSPSDKHEDIVEKVALYNGVGAVVWVVDPDFHTVSVHRPGEAVKALSVGQQLDGEPYLPGFRVPVAELFVSQV